MATGLEIVRHAEAKLGQEYVYGARVPLDDGGWSGPWDCAEYCSWAVFQTSSTVYGCTDDHDPPSLADAWTGAWKRDVLALGIRVSVAEASTIPGAMLLRRGSNSGHIVISNGDGNGTLEARGRLYGVVRYVIAGRIWDYGVLVPGTEYDRSNPPMPYVEPFGIRNVAKIRFSGPGVAEIQRRLSNLGFFEATPTGIFDNATEVAVRDFQISVGVTPDGQVDPETARLLGMTLNKDNFLIEPK